MTRRTTTPDDPTAAAAPPWRVALLGPVRAAHPALGAAAFRTQRAKSMLALLVDAGGAPLGRLQIATALWPESASGPANLACELFHLRKRFDAPGAPFFVAAGGALAVDPARCDADVAAFRAALAAAEAAVGPARLAALERAVALYGGPFAADVYDDWTDAPRRALADACLGALDALAEGHLAAGDPDRAIAHARRALDLDALDRRAGVALLAALAAAGGHGRARAAADAILADHAAAGVRPEAELARAIAAAHAGPRPERAATGGAADSFDVDPVPVLPSPSAPPSPAPPPLPSGTLTFVIADEAPDERRVARGPVRGEPWLPKSERERVLAAPADPAAAAHEREAARALAWRVFEGRVREAAGRCVAPRIAVFAGALDAVEAAAATLEALVAQDPLRRDRATMPQLRLALVTAEATPVDGAAGFPYEPAIAARLERLVAAAAGWQVLCEDATALLVAAEQQLNIGRRVERLGLVRLDPAAAPHAVHGLRYGGSEGFRYPPPAGLVPAAGAAALASSTSFVGRGDDLARIGAWIADPARRLITLKGLGGIGKTRLAMELAAAERDRRAVWSASLVDLRDGALIAAEVVKAMGESVPAGMTAEEVIVAALARRPSLLVLDNLEHLLEPAVAFIDRLLASDALPDLTVVATSRDRLKHSAEHVYDVAPLPVPDARPRPVPVLPPAAAAPGAAAAFVADPVRGNDSVRLFADRAAAKRAAFGDAFAADDAAAADVARLVTLLEGIPLAIELAAAKIAVLSPAQMADQIEQHLGGGRYGLLKGADRDIPERHKSLQAAMDWSWALLTPAQQRFLASLSVFRGGMTLEAAAYVTEDPEALDHLLALVDASLLQRVDVAGEREPRFGMLETVREYGEGCLRSDAILATTLQRQRVIEYFLACLDEAGDALSKNGSQSNWLDFFEAEHANIGEILDFAITASEDDRAHGLRMATALYRYWLQRDRAEEGYQRIVRLLPSDRSVTPLHSDSRFVAGSLAWWQGRRSEARRHLASVLHEAPRELRHKVLHNLAGISYEQGLILDAHSQWTESMKLKQELGELQRLPNTLNNIALTCWEMDQLDRAKCVVDQSLELSRELDQELAAGLALHLQYQIEIDQGEFLQARDTYAHVSQLLGTVADERLIVELDITQASYYAAIGEHERAIDQLERLYAIASKRRWRLVECDLLLRLAKQEIVVDQREQALMRLRKAVPALVALQVPGRLHQVRVISSIAMTASGEDRQTHYATRQAKRRLIASGAYRTVRRLGDLAEHVLASVQ